MIRRYCSWGPGLLASRALQAGHGGFVPCSGMACNSGGFSRTSLSQSPRGWSDLWWMSPMWVRSWSPSRPSGWTTSSRWGNCWGLDRGEEARRAFPASVPVRGCRRWSRAAAWASRLSATVRRRRAPARLAVYATGILALPRRAALVQTDSDGARAVLATGPAHEVATRQAIDVPNHAEHRLVVVAHLEIDIPGGRCGPCPSR
jgi:hypothetical protein